MYKLFTGDCLEVLKQFEDNSIDGCITDPPYGMGMEEWDHSVPTKEIWEEVKRVLKPGAFCLSFCSPRLYHRMACAVEDAGFNIKDQIMWMVTTKMPKKNRLKPAHEPIVVAQKPFKGSIQCNFDVWGVGKIDVDNTRVPWDGKPPTGWVAGGGSRRAFGKMKKDYYKFLDVSKEASFEEVKTAIEKMTSHSNLIITISENILCSYLEYIKEAGDILLDSKKRKKYDKIHKTTGTQKEFGKVDANPAGRYPSNIIGEVLPEHQKYFYAPRVTRKERGEYNNHPTPKPISLMAYLVKIYCPPGGKVLDPFCGSGGTGLGCLKEGRDFYGIDLEENYIDITEKRMKDFLDKEE